MHAKMDKHMEPKFYGIATVGERGQVVIPAEARREHNIKPADKLVVFGHGEQGGIMITKADSFNEFLNKSIGALSRFEEKIRGIREVQAEDGEQGL